MTGNQFSFFDPPQGSGDRDDPQPCGDRDVKRIVQHVRGPFRQLLNGQPTGREFRFVELHDSSCWYEFTDNGERVPVPFTGYIEDGIRARMFVEILSPALQSRGTENNNNGGFTQ